MQLLRYIYRRMENEGTHDRVEDPEGPRPHQQECSRVMDFLVLHQTKAGIGEKMKHVTKRGCRNCDVERWNAYEMQRTRGMRI